MVSGEQQVASSKEQGARSEQHVVPHLVVDLEVGARQQELSVRARLERLVHAEEELTGHARHLIRVKVRVRARARARARIRIRGRVRVRVRVRVAMRGTTPGCSASPIIVC